ncbi:MAG TPA: GAF domain-containing protein, partial [Planctomycetota bacterium]|nr:GAF domain-containing protein [Planctomycetota bacterium]
MTSAFLRRSIEESIPEARQAEVHLKIARGLVNCGGQISFEKQEIIAHHYLHSPDVAAAERWGLQLGGVLLRRQAYLGAGEVFERVAKRGGAQRLEAWESARTAWKNAGHFERMVAAARERVASDGSSAARTALAEALMERGEYGAAIVEYDAALKDASLPGKERARIELACGWIYSVLRRPAEEKARIDLARETGEADELGLAFAEGSHALNSGEGGEAVTRLEKALQLARKADNHQEQYRILRYLSRAYYMLLGKPDEARDLLKEATLIARRQGWRVQAVQTESLLATILDVTGAHAQSMLLKRRVLEVAIESGQWMLVSNFAQNLAQITSLHGTNSEAERAAQLAIEFADRTRERHVEARGYEILAVTAAQKSRPHDAERFLKMAEARVEGHEDQASPLLHERNRGIALWLSGAWRAGQPVLRKTTERLLDMHWPIDALAPMLGLAEALYHRRQAVDPALIDRARKECAPWKNRFATSVLDLVEGIGKLSEDRKDRALGLIERAAKSFGRDVGLDFRLCAGLAAARAAEAVETGASYAAEVYHKALSRDRLRFAEEAAEILGDLSARSGNAEGAERWYQEARRVFSDRRSEWFEEPSMGEDLQRRDSELREKAELRRNFSREEEWFRRLLEIERRLNSAADLDPILRMVMDALIDITGAERGYLVLVQDGKLAVRARRNMDKRDPQSADLRFSRTVVERVHRTGELFHCLNASEDPRLTGAVSVRELGIRSILCLPLQTANRRVGVVYLDNRHRSGVFETVNLERVEMFREKAALAMYRALLEDEV